MKICNPNLETGPGTLDSFCVHLSLHADSPCLGGQGDELDQFKSEVLHHYGVLYLTGDFIPHQAGHKDPIIMDVIFPGDRVYCRCVS